MTASPDSDSPGRPASAARQPPPSAAASTAGPETMAAAAAPAVHQPGRAGRDPGAGRARGGRGEHQRGMPVQGVPQRRAAGVDDGRHAGLGGVTGQRRVDIDRQARRAAPPLSTTASMPDSSLRYSRANRPSSSVVMNGGGSASRVLSCPRLIQHLDHPARLVADPGERGGHPDRARSASIRSAAPPPAKPAATTSSPRPASTRATARPPPPARVYIRLTWLAAPQATRGVS